MSKEDFVFIDWQDYPTIERAERKKARLENKGYRLVDTESNPILGISKLIYRLTDEGSVPETGY